MIIVYASNSGHTEQLAKLLGKELDIPAYSVQDIPSCHKGKEAIFMGWIMAGGVVGYKKAASYCQVTCVVGVGMSPEAPSMAQGLREKMKLGAGMPVFYIQGGYDINKLHGPYKLIMDIKGKEILSRLAAKTSRSEGEEATYKMVTEGYSTVSAEKLAPIVEWMKK